ncbi:M20/M25/M40 family metallo-hydrolase [Pirellulales bacterium]|nr:M20/M25/M40 family metallo-hydrolase [Pirellulales bacterium]
MPENDQQLNAICQAVNRDRLLETAIDLIKIPSPTRSAGPVADRLAEILAAEGCNVQREDANWPEAPAVIARLDSGQPGKTLQYDVHLDTVHLPFVPPDVQDGVLTGSGAADMKGGVAAAVESMRALRDSGLLRAGAILLTAHDHHEAPWGDCRQVHRLIEMGVVGDGVLLPEYMCDRIPVVGRGVAVIDIAVRRGGEPVHEVLRPQGQPHVIAAACELVRRLEQLNAELAATVDPVAGSGSVFIGQIHSGEIYNQSPTECRIQGTRRWLPEEPSEAVVAQYSALLAEVAELTGATIEGELDTRLCAFRMDERNPLVSAFQSAYTSMTGKTLPCGPKPFVDDGNGFVARGGIPAVTHGPDATGAHTLDERVTIDELVRVAKTYALTALNFCGKT